MSDLTLAERSVEQVRAWIEPGRGAPRHVDPAAERLAGLLHDPHGLDFTIGFVDRVMRPEDPRVAGRNLRALALTTPTFLPFSQRMLLKLGAVVAVALPSAVVGIARRMLRHMVAHLVIDADPDKLTRSLRRLHATGDRVTLNLLGDPVLGHREAARRRTAVIDLIQREDVDSVSVKVSSIASQLTMWAFDESVEHVVAQLTPIFAEAAKHGPTFVTLDMEEYRDLDLTIAAFTQALDHFPDLEAGIVLQTYLPDALGAMRELQAWAGERRAAGGAPIKVRLVKGANLAMERVESRLHGWPLATWATKQETDAHFKRVLEWSLRPERTDGVRIGVASQNLFDIAYAWLLAGDRGVRDAIDVEVLLGMDTGPLDAVRDDIGPVVLYTPVVHADEFDSAIAYLVRRLEENASSDSFMSAAYDISHDPDLLAREIQRFFAAVEAIPEPVPATHRVQERATEVAGVRTGRFVNAPDTDPSTPGNREWARRAIARASYTQLGTATVESSTVPGPSSLETVIHGVRQHAKDWQVRGSEVRAWILHAAAGALEDRRSDLVSVMVTEAGTTVAEADTEVSRAVDLAHYYAESCRRLEVVDGAEFVPDRLTVVASSWNEPVAAAAGPTLAALAAGSGVILTPSPRTRRCAAVMAEALWQAGVPRDVLRFVTLDEGQLSRNLTSHPQVDRVILTGSRETAELFRSWRHDLPLIASTTGKNAMIITPSADLDRAVADLVASAFGRAGQHCAGASLAILVGSVGRSERFRRQLVDAVQSLRVGRPDDPQVAVGPLIEPPLGAVAEGLTFLDRGESWLVAPRQRGQDSRVWSPGVRTGVRPGSTFHTTEYLAPVLGLMHARSLEQAIAWQNSTDYGLTAGIHSLDPREVNTWIDKVEAGNLYVNRGMTGAVVRRQPFGGWKRSAAGVTAHAGGPNYLTRLGSWQPRDLRSSGDAPQLTARITDLLLTARERLDADEYEWLVGAAGSDQVAYEREYGALKDVSRLEVERNVLRYVPAPVTIRFDGPLVELVRVLLVAERLGAPVTVSSRVRLPEGLVTQARVETHDQWLASVRRSRPERIRLIGPGAADVAQALEGDPDVAVHAGPVTASGRIEALPFLREQSISITNHRSGKHHPEFEWVLPRP